MLQTILPILLLFAVKLIDNILGTSKTILIQQNRCFLAALTNFISTIIFYKLIDAVNTSGPYTVYVVAFAAAIGTIIALRISERFSKDRLYVNTILCDDKEVMISLRDFLKEHKITNLTTDAYTKNFEKTLAITAYAETKAQSKLIDEWIAESNTKFKRIITKQ